MNDESRAILAIGSRMLSYPDDEFYNELDRIARWIPEYITTEKTRLELADAIESFRTFNLQELRELYVSLFDWKEKTGLYLTAHEYGDNRKRGSALIKLQKMITEAGYERDREELADYMPMLFEFMAAAPERFQRDRLQRRLAVAVYKIYRELPEDHPYTKVVSTLVTYVFGVPSTEEMKKLEQEKEKADLDALPYPLIYK